MKTLGLQLFTIRDHFKDDETIKESFKKMAEIGYGEAQTAGLFIEPENFVSKGKNNPFGGQTLDGAVKYTIVNGEVKYKA